MERHRTALLRNQPPYTRVCEHKYGVHARVHVAVSPSLGYVNVILQPPPAAHTSWSANCPVTGRVGSLCRGLVSAEKVWLHPSFVTSPIASSHL